MTYVLRRSVQVAPAGAQPPSLLKTIPAGTSLDDIAPDELAQLAPGHFTEDGGDGSPADFEHEHVGRLAREAAVSATLQDRVDDEAVGK